MDYEAISQLVFTHHCDLNAGQRSARLHPSLDGMLASADLLQAAEHEAIDALRSVIDVRRDSLIGVGLSMRVLAPARVGCEMRLDGWVQRLADGAAPHVDFIVLARDATRTLAEIELRFALVARERPLRRLGPSEPAPAVRARLAQPA